MYAGQQQGLKSILLSHGSICQQHMLANLLVCEAFKSHISQSNLRLSLMHDPASAVAAAVGATACVLADGLISPISNVSSHADQPLWCCSFNRSSQVRVPQRSPLYPRLPPRSSNLLPSGTRCHGSLQHLLIETFAAQAHPAERLSLANTGLNCPV